MYKSNISYEDMCAYLDDQFNRIKEDQCTYPESFSLADLDDCGHPVFFSSIDCNSVPEIRLDGKFDNLNVINRQFIMYPYGVCKKQSLVTLINKAIAIERLSRSYFKVFVRSTGELNYADDIKMYLMRYREYRCMCSAHVIHKRDGDHYLNTEHDGIIVHPGVNFSHLVCPQCDKRYNYNMAEIAPHMIDQDKYRLFRVAPPKAE